MLGALVGDAAGTRLEFLERLPTDEEVSEALAMPGGGPWGVAPGQVTDDGEMTIALLRALSEDGAFDLDRIAGQYRRWFESSPFDVGGTIRATIGAAANAAGMQRAAQRHLASKANGSLMRCSPLGVWGHALQVDELANCARLDSALSHANPSCQDAVACYVIATAGLIREGGDRRIAFEAAADWAAEHACEEVREWLRLSGTDEEAVPGFPQPGFVKIAFVHAFRHLRRGTDYVEAVRSVLAIGGDTDTDACIVGGLIGAAVGADKIPEALRAPVLDCDTRRGQPRPEWLHPREVPDLVRRLTSASAL